jgi:tetratricopeptide (TPR) repeat protein
MASIFLSYVREDVDKARAIATVLERAGHSVWWDLQIKGGAQYSAEIEAALAAADKVVVLWSTLSVKSAWVRDEAAFGRDRGHLIPVSVDGTESPLGFRQFQTVDLSSWRGRGAPDVEQLLDALATDAAPSMSAKSTPNRQSFRIKPPRWSAVAFALVAAGVVGGGWWWASRASVHPPTVAIEGTNEQSQEVARQLVVRLGDLQSARSDAFELISGAGNADLRIEVDAQDGRDTLRRDLSVRSGTSKAILWSASLEQPAQKADELSQQLVLTSERVLSCALEALADHRDRIDPSTLKLYLNGCSRLGDVYGLAEYDPELSKLFEQVIAKAPHFEGAWGKLLASEWEVADTIEAPPGIVAKLRKQITQAEALRIDIGEIYAAKAVLVPVSDFLGRFRLYDQGLRAHPDNPLLYRIHAEESMRVGRVIDSVFDANQAVKLDPLSPALQDNYISMLAYAGQIDAAYTQLHNVEAMWPNAENVKVARFRLDLRFGDPKAALAFYRSRAGGMDPGFESFLLARIDPTPSNIDHALEIQRAGNARFPWYISGLVQALAQFGRKDEAIDLMLHTPPAVIGYNADVLFRPAMRDVWRDPRSMAAAAHLGYLLYWEQSGHWPDFCADRDMTYDCKKEAAKYKV